jgi:hypothetical protein
MILRLRRMIRLRFDCAGEVGSKQRPTSMAIVIGALRNLGHVVP